METISKHTRVAFREHLVTWTLATIADLFDCADIRRVDVPPDQLPSGQRRCLVEEYYAGVDWASAEEVRKVISAYEVVLQRLEEPPLGLTDEAWQRRELTKLKNLLARDGFSYTNGRITSENSIDLSRVERASQLVDTSVLRDHLARIARGIDAHPDQAVGSAKELLKTVAKQVLEHFSEPYDVTDTVQQLVKRAMKALSISLEAIPEATRGAQVLKQLLSGLNQIVCGAAELRNLYGTGHGRTRRGGLQARHARLVVGAVSTLCIFLLETLDERKRARSLSKPAPV